MKLLRETKPKTLDVTIVEQPKSIAQGGEEETAESIAPTGVLADLDVRELTEDLAGRYGITSGERGEVVARVKPGSTAEEAGVREGDMIVEINRQAVGSMKPMNGSSPSSRAIRRCCCY